MRREQGQPCLSFSKILLWFRTPLNKMLSLWDSDLVPQILHTTWATKTTRSRLVTKVTQPHFTLTMKMTITCPNIGGR